MISGLLSPVGTCSFCKIARQPYRSVFVTEWSNLLPDVSDWVPRDSSFYAGQHEKFTPSLPEFVNVGIPVGDSPYNRISYDSLLVTLCGSRTEPSPNAADVEIKAVSEYRVRLVLAFKTGLPRPPNTHRVTPAIDNNCHGFSVLSPTIF